MDDRDQIITSVSPEVEKDAMLAARFVAVMLGMSLAVPMLILLFWVAFGAPGAVFVAVIGIFAIAKVGGHLLERGNEDG